MHAAGGTSRKLKVHLERKHWICLPCRLYLSLELSRPAHAADSVGLGMAYFSLFLQYFMMLTSETLAL